MPDYLEEDNGQSDHTSNAPNPGTSPTLACVARTSTKRKRRSASCPLCGELIQGKFKRHFQHHHLPWFMELVTACVECRHNEGSLAHLHARHSTHQRTSLAALFLWLGACTGFLYSLAGFLGCSFHSILDHILQTRSFSSETLDIPFITQVFWRFLEKYLNIPSTSKFTVNPPNSLAAVLHPSVLRHIIAGLPSSQQEHLKSFFELREPGGLLVSDPEHGIPFPHQLHIYDSHCHLFHLFHQTRAQSLPEVRVLAAPLRPAPLNFEVPVVICNVVHPTCWRELAHSLVPAREWPELFFSVGMHPTSWDGLSKENLLEAADNPRVVAIGECGLDTHLVPSNGDVSQVVSRQLPKLKLQLEVARFTKLPVIIHVRARDGDIEGLSKLQGELLHVMRSILAPEHPVHLHCFRARGSTVTAGWPHFQTRTLASPQKYGIPPCRRLS